MNENPEMILCIPGPWKDRGELMMSIVDCDSGYLFAGRILMNLASEHSCEIDYAEQDPNMVSAFRAAGRHWDNTPEMEAITTHRSVVYLISDGGSREDAQAMMLAAKALLKAGGLGVKVESSGLAHSPDAWIKMCQNLHLFSAHRALVVNIADQNEVYSCGMHNLGLYDAITTIDDKQQAVELLQVFTWYLFTESPELKAGQTFSVDAEADVYRLREHQGINYGEKSLFNNPYGTWELVPVL